jgi:hypothetical protein
MLCAWQRWAESGVRWAENTPGGRGRAVGSEVISNGHPFTAEPATLCTK